MNVIKVYRNIDSDTLKIEELNEYTGRKAEILIIFEDERVDRENEKNYREVLKIIKQNQGTLKKYTRNELHER